MTDDGPKDDPETKPRGPHRPTTSTSPGKYFCYTTSTEGTVVNIPLDENGKPKETEIKASPQSLAGDVKVTLDMNVETDQIIVNFGRPVNWLGMNLQQAQIFARLLWAKAEELEKAVPRAKVIRLPLRKPEEIPK